MSDERIFELELDQEELDSIFLVLCCVDGWGDRNNHCADMLHKINPFTSTEIRNIQYRDVIHDKYFTRNHNIKFTGI